MGKRNNGGKDDKPFQDMPTEMCFKIFSYLDIESFHAVRGVSKRWKFLADSSRNLSFTCDLTDLTTLAVINSNESFFCIKIHDFEAKHNKIVSSTRGTGRVLGCADSIHLIGRNINAVEIGKLMWYAVGSVNELVFQHCRRSVLKSVFDLQKPFEFLQKLTICHKRLPTRRDTSILQSLGSTTKLPLLEYFKIVYELENLEDVFTLQHFPSPDAVFANYLAMAQFLLRHKDTLKTVEILRNEILRTALMINLETFNVRLSQMQRHRIQECLEGFKTLKLENVHICPLLEEDEFPWTLEASLLKQQRNIKELNYDRKLSFPVQQVNEALLDALPLNRHLFTSVKISLTCAGNEPVDLSLFSQCPNLKTLWLLFYRGMRLGIAGTNSLHFTNLEQLPKTITSFHLKSSQEDPIIIHQQSILTRAQIRWIIDNLKELQSIWLQLVTEEDVEDDVPVLVDDDEAQRHVENVPVPEQEDAEQILNANANIDTQTFRQLISLPKLRDTKFDMVRARQLGANVEIGFDGHPWVVPVMPLQPHDFHEYIDICQEDATITFNPNEVDFFPIRFIEISMTRK